MVTDLSCVLGVGDFNLRCVLVELTIPNLIYSVYEKSLKLDLKPFFLLQNTLLDLWMCVLNSQRIFCSQQKLVLNAM